MEHRPDTVDPASLAPPYRALFEGLRAEVAALTERNRKPEAVVEGLRSRVASLTEHNRRLEHLLRELRRAMFAKKSEKLHPDQLLLAFEELEGVLAEADAPASTTPTPRAKRPAAERNIGHLPDHLPRTYEVEPPRESRRLHLLSLWEEKADDFTDKILPGSPGAGSAPGARSPG